MPYGSVPSMPSGGLSGLLARALSRLNFPALHGAGEAIRPGIEQGILEPGARAIGGLQGFYGDLGETRLGRATQDAFIDPGYNLVTTMIPGTENNQAFADDAWNLTRGVGEAILNPQEPSIWDSPPEASSGPAGPMASVVAPQQVDQGPMSAGIEPYPSQPSLLGDPRMEQVPEYQEPPMSPLAAMLGEQRDYDAEVEKWRQMQLGQFLMRAGAGMGSAPLGDVSGGFARAGAGVADFMAGQPSQEQYRASLEQEDMAQDFATVKLAKALEDLNSPDSDRILNSAISQLPRAQQREAMVRKALGDGPGLALILGVGSGDIKTVTVDGVSMQTRTGLDGTPEFRFFGREEWMKGDDPRFPAGTADAYQRSTQGIRRSTDKDFAARNKSRDTFESVMQNREEGGDVGYNDLFDEQQRAAQSEYRKAPVEVQQESIEEFMNDSERMEALGDIIGRVPTQDDVAMYKANGLAGLGVGFE